VIEVVLFFEEAVTTPVFFLRRLILWPDSSFRGGVVGGLAVRGWGWGGGSFSKIGFPFRGARFEDC
jgi:hypothetical protein